MNSPLLQGGTRRRPGRRRRYGVVLLMLVALGGVTGSLLYLTDWKDDDSPAASTRVPDTAPRAPVETPTRPATQVPPGISLVGPNAFKVRLKSGKPRAALVFDMKTGRVLYKRNPLRRMPMASLTKIMTALIVVDETRPREKARVTKHALGYSGSGVGVLPKGKKVPVEGLLAGLLLPSGNDAAIALAEHVSGSERRFVRTMNRRARRLGLRCTKFVSPHGLEPRNRSCAADLAALTRLAIGQPRIARIVRRARASVPFPIKGKRLEVSTTNPLLRARYPGTIGLKTGFTNRAGHCLIAVVRRGGHTVAAVLLHSPNTAAQAKRMIEAGLRALAREDAG